MKQAANFSYYMGQKVIKHISYENDVSFIQQLRHVVEVVKKIEKYFFFEKTFRYTKTMCVCASVESSYEENSEKDRIYVN